MSYSSRVYRQRNPKPKEDSKEEGFFSKQHEKKANQKNAFFQQRASAAAQSSSVQRKKISNIQKLATPKEDEKTGTNDERMKRDKDIQEKTIQTMCDSGAKKDETADKPVQKKEEGKEEKKVQKKEEGAEKEKPVQKKDEPKKEENKSK
ncbi:hypothetical protein HHL16_12320 [Pseudoflavitalea sp. G-6-1-2]|uniref:hypothetical protein n=1 Tax=Pseudoflavitalea sp. G-6-1-2 TaxID=2728841 RepID=UPI00146C8E96|nr:hypothetical protein [Pseudoflavitalea sp. G-6-1-2]NML21667.1 hypothetical protein [Pseudoflavitalea sp. G-6-1-2]